MDSFTGNLLVAWSLAIGTGGFVLFGWLSDKIGRKPIILAGCLIAALTYMPIFNLLTKTANPALHQAQQIPVTVVADPADCSFQFNPTGTVKFTNSCDIAKAKLNRSPNYMDLNHIIALIMSSVTASLRFPGKLNTDLGEFVTNLVPFPGNHFLTASFAPMRAPGQEGQVRINFPDVARETFSQDNFTAAIDWQNGVYLSACALFRGDVTAKEVEEKTPGLTCTAR